MQLHSNNLKLKKPVKKFEYSKITYFFKKDKSDSAMKNITWTLSMNTAFLLN